MERTGKSAEIADAFTALEQRLPFRVETETGRRIPCRIQKLVSGDFASERDGRPRGEVTVVMQVVWDALIADIGDEALKHPLFC